MKRPVLVAFGLGLAACVPPQAGSNRAAECTTKAHAKYDGTSAKEIEQRLRTEAARVSWDGVPEPYRAWAMERLQSKLSAASVTLAASGNCKEVEAAASKIAGLAKRIGEVAKQCTEPQCTGQHAEAPEIDRTLDAAICPLFPFC